MKKHSRGQLGFTLVELLVVVLIIGILTAVALPQYQKAVQRARAVELWNGLDAWAKGQKLYYLRTRSYATDFSDLDIEIPTSKYFAGSGSSWGSGSGSGSGSSSSGGNGFFSVGCDGYRAETYDRDGNRIYADLGYGSSGVRGSIYYLNCNGKADACKAYLGICPNGYSGSGTNYYCHF